MESQVTEFLEHVWFSLKLSTCCENDNISVVHIYDAAEGVE
jgi:hypothetical protein